MFETIIEPALQAIVVAWKPILAISTYFLVLFATGEILYRLFNVPTEHTRKLCPAGRYGDGGFVR